MDKTYDESFNELKSHILTLSYWAWEGYPRWTDVNNWLENFDGSAGCTKEEEQLHALYILSQFMYFGSRQIRALLQALYRDHFLIPLIQKIRSENNNTRSIQEIKHTLRKEIGLTRFLGIGNPSESGIHLLYYFRQENHLPLSIFCDIANVLIIKEDSMGNNITELSNPKIVRYVFIDDMCGSGDAAITYSNNILSKIKNINNSIEFYYLTLFGTKSGLEKVKQKTVFNNNCFAIFELDSTYKILSNDSRYIASCPEFINKNIISSIIRYYGVKLWKKHPCGYRDNQLILGMHHNIPNNTIPIIWFEGKELSWIPIFKRYVKVEGIVL